MNDFFNWDEIEKRCGGAQNRFGGDRDAIRKRRMPSARFFPAAMHEFSTMSETDKEELETDDSAYDDLFSSSDGPSDGSPTNEPLPPQSPLPAPALAAVPPSPLSMRGGRHSDGGAGSCTAWSTASTLHRGRFSMHGAALQLVSPISPFFMEQNVLGRAGSDLTSLRLANALWRGGKVNIDSTNNSSNTNHNRGNYNHHHNHHHHCAAKPGHTHGARKGSQHRSSRHGCIAQLPKTQTLSRRPRTTRSLSVTEAVLFLLSLRRLEEVQPQRASLTARTSQSKDHLAKQYRRLTDVEPPAQSSASTLAYADGNSDEDADDEEDKTSSDDGEMEYGKLDTHHAVLVRQLRALGRVNDELRRRRRRLLMLPTPVRIR